MGNPKPSRRMPAPAQHHVCLKPNIPVYDWLAGESLATGKKRSEVATEQLLPMLRQPIAPSVRARFRHLSEALTAYSKETHQLMMAIVIDMAAQERALLPDGPPAVGIRAAVPTVTMRLTTPEYDLLQARARVEGIKPGNAAFLLLLNHIDQRDPSLHEQLDALVKGLRDYDEWLVALRTRVLGLLSKRRTGLERLRQATADARAAMGERP